MSLLFLTDLLEDVASYNEVLTCVGCRCHASHYSITSLEAQETIVSAVFVTCVNASSCSTPKWWVCLPCKKTSKTWASLRKHQLTNMHVTTSGRWHADRRNLTDVSMEILDNDNSHFPMEEGDFDHATSDPFEDATTNNPPLHNHTLTSTENEWLNWNVGIPVTPSTSLAPYFHPESKSPAFYEYVATNPGQGARFLTAKAFKVGVDQVTTEEAEFSLRMASLLSKLSIKEQEGFAYCLLHAVNSKEPELTIFNATRVPVSVADFRDFYLSDNDAVIPNLPIPVTLKTPDGNHAYVGVLDVFGNMLAACTPVDDFRHFATKVHINQSSRTNISSTEAAHQLYMELVIGEDGEFVLIVWITEWCDDFDPFGTKSNRKQVWIKTYTICPRASATGGQNTFFMAIGGKGDDHEDVEKIFTKELEELSTTGRTFFHGGMNKLIRVKAGMLVTCVDRPERTKLFSCGDHNGSFSVCWGFAAQIDGTCRDNKLPSCPICRRKRLVDHLEIDPGDLPPIPIVDLDSARRRPNPPRGDEESSQGTPSSSANDGDSSSDSPSVEVLFGETCRHAEGAEGAGTCGWDLLDDSFTFATPADFPLTYDTSDGAPPSPMGREITGEPNEERRLSTVYITVIWLCQAARFAYHQVKTRPVGTHRNKRFWTKTHACAYLRTCGIVKKLQDLIVSCAKNGEECPIPTYWTRSRPLDKCHYAAMHMLFLGHVKSNGDMIAKWMKSHELYTTFGQQAQIYLRAVAKLRLRRFNAHTLATSTLGNGSWVSENYLFWARGSKFFYAMASLTKCKHVGKKNFDAELRIVHRFVAAQGACLCRLMSGDPSSDGISDLIKIYLDTMVEMDRLLITLKPDAAISTDHADQVAAANPNKKKTRKARKAAPNFVKANSLGLMAAADAHAFFGPAILHWEGGYRGERKIQEVKPRMGIRRANADWQSIILRQLYEQESMDRLLSEIRGQGVTESRSADGLFYIYKTMEEATNAVNQCEPLSAIIAKRSVHLVYRPTGEFRTQETTRSSVNLLEICFDDNPPSGKSICGCWLAPIQTGRTIVGYTSVSQLMDDVEQNVLMLPMMADSKNGKFENSYYALGDKWTERVQSGEFVPTPIARSMFTEWGM
jgi:hypothetical protein